MLRAIKTFIKDPKPTGKLEEVEPGLNIVEGVVRVSKPLRSPVRQQNCAAFFYRSFFFMAGEKAPAAHKIKEAQGYAPFELEMEGGALQVVPPRESTFEHQDHVVLAKQYGQTFHGVEELVLPGARVRVRGKVKVADGRKVLTLKDITVLEKQVVAQGVVGDRKKRKKNR